MKDFNYFFNFFSEKLKEESFRIKDRTPHNLYEPISYSLEMGGKRIRPVLLLMAYNLFKADYEKALPLAYAIEIFHNFTLLHDDIMDKSIMRRNKETVHIKYSENTAILSGDAMSILSYEYLSKWEGENLREILGFFTQTALKICEGQQWDMDFETKHDVTIPDYIDMIGLKTAVLLAASLKLGAMAAGSSASNMNHLNNFGYNLGLAFQLQDDLLDSFGNTEEFGKNIGGDIVTNKKTFLLLSALNLANDTQKESLEKWIAAKDFDPSAKINEVVTIYNELDIEEKTQKQIEHYFNIAYKSWEKIDIEKEKKIPLLNLANQLMNRKQ